jgi:lysyl-tRNA synthetase class 2
LRTKKILALRESQQPNPYPHKFNVTQSIPHYIEEFGVEGKIKPGEKFPDATVRLPTPASSYCTPAALTANLICQVSLAGRVGNMRSAGANLQFLDLHAEGKKVQIMAAVQ